MPYLFGGYIKLEEKVSYLRGLLCNLPPLLCEALWESIRGPAQLDVLRLSGHFKSSSGEPAGNLPLLYLL
ncbi:hypothetical protein Ciccas_013745 [Cichlidogyrus casuarinus]|uniref:Uncharacterized protein n=1 Tax=Cichlidogyrus casuarinus TaxID=1844966 RepID=A0ABD2PMV8_9PLAT